MVFRWRKESVCSLKMSISNTLDVMEAIAWQEKTKIINIQDDIAQQENTDVDLSEDSS